MLQDGLNYPKSKKISFNFNAFEKEFKDLFKINFIYLFVYNSYFLTANFPQTLKCASFILAGSVLHPPSFYSELLTFVFLGERKNA